MRGGRVYSYRRASMGSELCGLVGGIVAEEYADGHTEADCHHDGGQARAGGVAHGLAQPRTEGQPSRIPAMPPIRQRMTLSVMNCIRIAAAGAPSALRVPISGCAR